MLSQIDPTMNYFQKETTSKHSFDLFSGLFIHNRFARQQVKNSYHFSPTMLNIIVDAYLNQLQFNNSEIHNHMQMECLELALEKTKQKLQERLKEEQDLSMVNHHWLIAYFNLLSMFIFV